MTYPHSIVLIIGSAMRDAAEAVGQSIGHSGAEYSVPLSPDGEAPATHFGLHCWGSDSFLATLGGTAPDHIDEAEFTAVKQALTVSVRASSENHFDDVLAETGLIRIVTVDPSPAEA